MCPALRTDTDITLLSTSEDAYERFIIHHLQQCGLFTGEENSLQEGLSGSSPRKWRRGAYRHSTLITNRHSADSHDSNQEEGEEQDPGLRPAFSFHLGQALRTRQLVIDFDGERPVPRLREPAELCPIHSLSSPFQGVRWPIECDVIKEPAIQHIEWEPPDPELFYQPTGQERAPMPVGPEKGNVVYCIDPATKTSYFTYSRVGGSRGPIKNATSCASGQGERTLAFESRFESGNLQKAVQVGLHDYELTLQTDLYTTKHTQWFYFRVKNMRAGVTYRFTVVNLTKARSLYGLGMRPLLYSETAAREEAVGWRRTGSNIRYYRNQQLAGQAEQDNNNSTKPLYSLTWTCQFPHDADTCYLAHCYPYTYSQLQRYLSQVTSDPATGAYCKLRMLCRSLAGNAVHVLTVTSPGGGWAERRARRAVVVTARVHPGETNGSWMMQGFLDFLLGASDDARLLRDTFVFKVVPMLNPDGVVVGNYRCSLTGRDLNRNYRTLLRDSFPCVWHTRNMVKRLLAEREVVLYCDFHGHSRKNNVFMYGCDNRHDPTLRLHERLFPLMMSKNAHDKFSYRSCKFRVQKSKEGTGRIVMWRLGVRNSYTMESTFGGSTLGNRKGTHFTTHDLKSLGFYFCDTLLDYCDPDPTKTRHCLAELGALLREEVKQRLGRELDSDGSLCSISVSDIESSTSGSNSTESDGLPVHLLHQPMESISVKKKHLRSRKERNRLRKERHRSADAKHTEPVLAQETEAKDTAQEKTVVVRAERQSSAKVPFIVKVSRHATRTWIPHPPTRIGVNCHMTMWEEHEKLLELYLRNRARQRSAHTERKAQPCQELSRGTSEEPEEDGQHRRPHRLRAASAQSPQPAARQRPLSVSPSQHRSLCLPTCTVRIQSSHSPQQRTPFASTGWMRGKLPAQSSTAPRSASGVPGTERRVVPESVLTRGLEPSYSATLFPDTCPRQRAACDAGQGQAARLSIHHLHLPEAAASEPHHRSAKRDSTLDVCETAPWREKRAAASSLDESPSNPDTSLLSELRSIDLRGTRFAQKTSQEGQEVGELPQASRPPFFLARRESIHRLQKFSLVHPSSLASAERRGGVSAGPGSAADAEAGPGTRMVQGPGRAVNSRLPGSALPCNTAPLS